VPPEDDEIGRLAQTMNAMLDRLQAAADRQRRFVADASHELQSPLAASRTDLEVALAHPSSTAWPVTARDLLAQNDRMQRLVADLLFLARSDACPALTDPAPVDLHELVLAEATRAPGDDRVTVDVSAVEPAFVLGRAADLRRAVRNLLENACQHASSTVSVALRTAGDTARLVVEDDGPGIPAGDRARIFERFARLDTARSRTTGGTGLGLAIVKEAVERHHGLVRVEDSPSGARFVVTLPPD
jgi:signal transduction histidine kinase